MQIIETIIPESAILTHHLEEGVIQMKWADHPVIKRLLLDFF